METAWFNASTTIAADNAGAAYVWFGIILALIVAGVTMVYFLRAKLLSDSDPSNSVGFTLGEIREMRASGQMSQTEYEAARDMLLGRDGLTSETPRDKK